MSNENLYDYEAKFIEACWYTPKEDTLLTPEEQKNVLYTPNTPCLRIEIEGNKFLIWDRMLNQGLQVDGMVLFVYEPPNDKNNGLLDSFNTPNDFDEETRSGAFIVGMTKEETQKARDALEKLEKGSSGPVKGSFYSPFPS